MEQRHIEKPKDLRDFWAQRKSGTQQRRSILSGMKHYRGNWSPFKINSPPELLTPNNYTNGISPVTVASPKKSLNFISLHTTQDL